MKQLGEEEQEVTDKEEDEWEDDKAVEPLPPKLKYFKESVQSLEDGQQFVQSRGYIEEGLRISSATEQMSITHCIT